MPKLNTIPEYLPGGQPDLLSYLKRIADYINKMNQAPVRTAVNMVAQEGQRILADSTGTALHIALPKSADSTLDVTVKRIGVNAVTVEPQGQDKIDNGGSLTIPAINTALIFSPDGQGGWWLMR